MKFKRLINKGLVICQPDIIKDSRGFFSETFKKNELEKYICKSIDFCQENLSESKYGVLRGLHFQKQPFSQSKLINVQKGKILDVTVDIRKNSKYYGKSFSIELDDVKNRSLFIPKGFAHGFIVLSKIARVSYKVDNYYNLNSQEGFRYNDPELNINWKIDEKSIIINKKDLNYSDFNSNEFF